MQQYKVPQNIDLEDKIVGPFTMKQFGYLMGGGALVYAIYQGFLPYNNGAIYAILLGAPVAILVMCLTFIKVNDRPFEYFILNFFKYITNPKKMIWQRGYVTDKVIIQTPVAQKATTGDASKKAATLDDIAKRLDMTAGNTGAPGAQKNQGQAAPTSPAPPRAGGETNNFPPSQGETQRGSAIPASTSPAQTAPPVPAVQGVVSPAIQPKRSIMRDIFGIKNKI